jgi:hypothetical protein
MARWASGGLYLSENELRRAMTTLEAILIVLLLAALFAIAFRMFKR